MSLTAAVNFLGKKHSAQGRNSAEIVAPDRPQAWIDRDAILAVIKVYFCKGDTLIKPVSIAEIAEKAALAVDHVAEIMRPLAEGGVFLTLADEELIAVGGMVNPFETFKIYTKDAKSLIKEARHNAYQDSDKPRKPRQRVKNNPKLVKSSGNRCGHAKEVLPVFTLPEAAKKRPNPIALLLKKLSDFYMSPELLPDIKYARGAKIDKHGDVRNQRTEGRESFVLFAAAVVSRCDLLTMRVGSPVNEDAGFVGIRLAKLAEIAGISFSRAERICRVFVKAGYLSVVQRADKLADGTYKGYAAVRLVSPRLFKAFGLGQELFDSRKWLSARKLRSDDRFKDSKGNMKAVADVMAKIEDSFKLAAEATEHSPHHIFSAMMKEIFKK